MSAGTTPPRLRVDRLAKAFGGLQAVLDVSFAVEPASITGLIGPNGSGKTVTFDCVTGFYRPDRGRVFLGDRELTGLRPNEVALAGVARSFQVTGVFPRVTVWQNLTFAAQEKRLLRALAAGRGARPEASRATRARLERVLDFTGLADLRDEPVRTLPHGQQKILELGGLMVMNPDPALYMLDEPFAGLTQAEIGRYVTLMQELRALGKTFLIVEHNMRVMMSLCQTIVALDHGEKIAEGTPAEVQASPRVVAAYLGHAGTARRR